MALDRIVGIIFLLISLVYGFAAFNYPLLPFERNMAFLPTTLPKALSVAAVVLALLLILLPKRRAGEVDDGSDATSLERLREFKIGQALALILAMVLYAVLLRPIGFVGATTLFIAGAGWSLGERKLHVMVPVAIGGAVFVWYLVQEVLGIFLKPWPWFIG